MYTEDRELFVEKLNEINVKTIKSDAVETWKMPVERSLKNWVIRSLSVPHTHWVVWVPVSDNDEELNVRWQKGLLFLPQVLVEKSLKGWKEVEFEVVRDTVMITASRL